MSEEAQEVDNLKLLQRWEELMAIGEEYKLLGRKIKKLFKGREEEIGDFRLTGEWIEKDVEATTTEEKHSRTWKMSISKKVGEEQIRLL